MVETTHTKRQTGLPGIEYISVLTHPDFPVEDNKDIAYILGILESSVRQNLRGQHTWLFREDWSTTLGLLERYAYRRAYNRIQKQWLSETLQSRLDTTLEMLLSAESFFNPSVSSYTVATDTSTAEKSDIHPPPKSGIPEVEHAVIGSASTKIIYTPRSKYEQLYAKPGTLMERVLKSRYSAKDAARLFSINRNNAEDIILYSWKMRGSLVPERDGTYRGNDLVGFALRMQDADFFRNLGYNGKNNMELLRAANNDLMR